MEPGPAFGVIEESTNSNWRGSVSWEATLRDSVRVSSTRGTRISSGTGSHKVATRSTIAWTHLWTDRMRSNLGFATGEDVFKGTDRVDELAQTSLSLDYNLRRNMLLNLGWYYLDRESTEELFTYDKNRVNLKFTWEL
jgi:uncharacterized protein (PEP-CTERM system associated)